MEDIPSPSSEQVEELLKKDIDDLFVMLSEAVPLYVDGLVVRQTRAQALARGKELFERSKEALRQKICIEWDYCKRKKKFTKPNEVFQAVLTIIATIKLATGLAALSLALILFKIGLDKFCTCVD